MIERVKDFWNANWFYVMIGWQVAVVATMIIAIASGKVIVIK